MKNPTELQLIRALPFVESAKKIIGRKQWIVTTKANVLTLRVHHELKDGEWRQIRRKQKQRVYLPQYEILIQQESNEIMFIKLRLKEIPIITYTGRISLGVTTNSFTRINPWPANAENIARAALSLKEQWRGVCLGDWQTQMRQIRSVSKYLEAFALYLQTATPDYGLKLKAQWAASLNLKPVL